jgi:hypothetical protein
MHLVIATTTAGNDEPLPNVIHNYHLPVVHVLNRVVLFLHNKILFNGGVRFWIFRCLRKCVLYHKVVIHME